jgi:hypothetical protein
MTTGTCPRCSQTEYVSVVDGIAGMKPHMLPGDGPLIECGGTGSPPVNAAAVEYQAAETCPFNLPLGVDRHLAHEVHSQAASLAYALFSPHADPEDAGGPELIKRAAFVAQLAQTLLGRIVEEQRGRGMSWQQIGDTLHITKQAAQQRFGR